MDPNPLLKTAVINGEITPASQASIHWIIPNVRIKIHLIFIPHRIRLQLNKYESGLNLLPVEILTKLAEALATTIDSLLTGNPVEDNPLANKRLFRRFRAVERFDDDDQEAIIKLIDAMIAKQQMQSVLQPFDDAASAQPFERQHYASR